MICQNQTHSRFSRKNYNIKLKEDESAQAQDKKNKNIKKRMCAMEWNVGCYNKKHLK